MPETTYTYRIRVSDLESVKVEIRDPKDDVIEEPSGNFQLDEEKKAKITALKEKAAYRPSAGEQPIREDEIVELGTTLYETLLDSELKNNLLHFYHEIVHQKDSQLRIELDIDEEKLPFVASLPWEFLHVPSNKLSGDLWLATSPDVIFSRRRTLWLPPTPVQLALGEKLRIAIVVSAPKDEELGKVDYRKLYAELQELAKELGDRVELELLDPEQYPATRQTIDQILEREPHIFHFIGHGRFTKNGNQDVGEIAVMNDLGRARWVNAAKFSNLFTRHRPSIVLLQACEGGQLSSSTAFSGVASQIVQQNIPVVVAMQYEVSNATARRFAREFYTRLAKGEPVDKAAQEGRNAIADWHETRDFATPVLFMRVRHGHLFQQVIDAQKPHDQIRPVVKPPDNPDQPVREIPPAPATLTIPQVGAIARLLKDNFTIEEMAELCLDLGFTIQEVGGETSTTKAQQIVDRCRRYGQVSQLWLRLHQLRAHVKWSEALI